MAALTDLAGKKGPRVLIAEYPCPIHARRVGQAKKTPPARVVGDPETCLEVRDKLACPAFAMGIRCEEVIISVTYNLIEPTSREKEENGTDGHAGPSDS